MDKLSLEARVKAEIYNFSGKLSLYANDFKGNVVELNSEEKFETASCIKVFIMAELFRRIHRGEVSPDQLLEYKEEHYVVGSGVLRALDRGVRLTAKDFATLMIIVSDNIATNVLIDFLGADNINNTCKELGFKDTVLHNPIDFKKYDRLGTTTPRDYGSFFEKLYRKELWGEELSRQMLDILGKQHYNTMLVKELAPYYLDSEDTGDEELISIASKSGSMDACRNDGGLISTPYGSYAIAIFTKEFRDSLYYSEHESYRFGARVSRLMFDHYISLKGAFR
ncbi:MAG TPA: serine hydrolase [Clostridia bacterium]|nr:serine hydrolase [Clostridia bacterium]